jgi:threonine aldolase
MTGAAVRPSPEGGAPDGTRPPQGCYSARMKIHELRSDTFTLPGPGMCKAMAEAELGDDVYAEDPTVNRLQELAAAATGKEAALFVSSGSMGNLIPLYLNCGRGNEVLVDSQGHIVLHELASAAAIAGVLPVQIPTRDGILSVADLETRIEPDIYYCAHTRMVEVENTHNAGGGTFYTLERLREIGAFAHGRGMVVHMDGARLFNAVAASGAAAPAICAQADTVTFCLSKGLGAPVGAVLCGKRDFIAEARRVRKMLGGGMRQAGVIAAAGLYALQNNVERVAEDHENAKLIARALAGTSWARLDPEKVVTNIVYFNTPGRNADDVVAALERVGIRGGSSGPDQVRFVTHLDISRADAQDIARIIEKARLP